MNPSITIERPEGMYQRATVEWRIAEFVRVLNAKVLITNAGRDFQVDTYFYSDSPGPKFTRIVIARLNDNLEGAVHCFVENATGKVIKASGWTTPAKEKNGLAYRWDLMDDDDRALLYSKCDSFSSIFYAGVPEKLRAERDAE